MRARRQLLEREPQVDHFAGAAQRDDRLVLDRDPGVWLGPRGDGGVQCFLQAVDVAVGGSSQVEQPDRPEILLGAALGRGKTLEEAKAEARLRVEAVELIPRITEFAATHKVAAPIFGALSEGMLKAQPVAEVITKLMTGPASGFV